MVRDIPILKISDVEAAERGAIITEERLLWLHFCLDLLRGADECVRRYVSISAGGLLSNCDRCSRRKKQTTTVAFGETGRVAVASACLLDAERRSIALLWRQGAQSWVYSAGFTRLG